MSGREPPPGWEGRRRALVWTQRALLAIGGIALASCGLMLLEAALFQFRGGRHLDSLLAWARNGQGPASGKAAAAAPAEGDIVGRIEIARLGMSTIIAEGAEERTLRVAVGHLRGTAMPGQKGNVVLSGHRDTFFRPLRNIREDDTITIETPDGEFRYRVTSTQVVPPERTDVLARTADSVLTLITCHPFGYIGPAPNRFVVRARQLPPPAAPSRG